MTEHVAPSLAADVERPTAGRDAPRPAVISLDSRRPIPCPHCDVSVSVRRLDQHLRFDCPVLVAKRRHPSYLDDGA